MRTTGTRLATGGLVAVCVAVVLPGTAGATSAKQLVKNAIAATEAARSLTFAGTVVESSATTISLSVSSDRVSGAGEGSLTIGSGTAVMRLVGGTIYIKADTAFWTSTSGASAAQELAGRWVSTSASSTDGKELANFVNQTDFLRQLFSTNLTNSRFTVAGTATVGRKQATVIRGHDSKNKASGSLYVARSGKPYVLKLVLTSGAGHGTILFTGFNKPVHPVVPTGAIDLDTLGSSSG